MRYLHCCCVRLQMIVDPAAEDRRFHGSRPRLRKCLQPGVQLPARRANLALLVNLTAGILYAIGSSSCADPVRFLCRSSPILVQIQSDVIHMCCTCTNIYLSQKVLTPMGYFSKNASATLSHPCPRGPCPDMLRC